MKILIELPAEHYDLFVAECDIKSREYSILKNALVSGEQNARENKVIHLLCDKEELEILLEAAHRHYPNVVPALEAGLTVTDEV